MWVLATLLAPVCVASCGASGPTVSRAAPQGECLRRLEYEQSCPAGYLPACSSFNLAPETALSLVLCLLPPAALLLPAGLLPVTAAVGGTERHSTPVALHKIPVLIDPPDAGPVPVVAGPVRQSHMSVAAMVCCFKWCLHTYAGFQRVVPTDCHELSSAKPPAAALPTTRVRTHVPGTHVPPACLGVPPVAADSSSNGWNCDHAPACRSVHIPSSAVVSQCRCA